MTIRADAAPHADDARLRAFWNSRYSDFTLSESGWLGAGERLNARIYACKTQALQRALTALGRTRGDRFTVLDAGCGQGFFAGFYRSAYAAATYVGIDISERAVRHLRHTIDNAEFHVADLATWSDPARRRFDIVQSFEVLHLILDDRVFAQAIANFAAHLADAGALLVTAAFPPETIERAGYLRYRSRRVWDEALRSADLEITGSRPIYYWLPAGGPSSRIGRFVFARLGVDALYRLDRAALALRLPGSRRFGHDCAMQLLTIQKKSR